jgi:hypothetical protein
MTARHVYREFAATSFTPRLRGGRWFESTAPLCHVSDPSLMRPWWPRSLTSLAGDSTPANTRAPVRQFLRVAELVRWWTTIHPTLLDLGYPLSHAHLVLPLRSFPFSRPQMKLESSGHFRYSQTIPLLH